MPAVDDWINTPLVTVQNIYEKCGSDSHKHIKDYFDSKINDSSSLSLIPSVNDVATQDLRSNCLLRYRCMVQDMYDPEFYLDAYEVIDKRDSSSCMKCGKFQDITQCPADCELNLDSDKNITGDRLTLYCVPIPGENAWTKHAYKQTEWSKDSTAVSNTSKRSIDSCHADDVIHCNGAQLVNNAVTGETKKLCSDQASSSTTKGIDSQDLNFPLPGEKGRPCLVKVYDGMNDYKVNDLVEFVGVFSADPNLTQLTDDSMQTDDYIDPVATAFPEESQAKSPPSSLVPRLHAILSRPLCHNNPLLSPTFDINTVKHKALVTKRKLLEILQHAVFGDQLAAEYVLYNLLSSVYSRADVMPLGKFCINLINAPCGSRYSRLLHHLVANITTHSHLIEMSLASMNAAPFSPYKDYTTDRLRSGQLQLSDGTHLILDETALQPGQLEPTGVKNVSALGTLISWQKVEYDFRYHRQDFMSNVSVLILSEGSSLLPADFRMPLAPQCDPADLTQYFSDIDQLLTPDTLDDIRRYLTVTRNAEFVMDDQLQKDIQNDFVESRKHDPDTMTVDDFHSLLNLVRLLSQSEGSCTGSHELWAKAKQMESERKQRVLLLPAPHINP